MSASPTVAIVDGALVPFARASVPLDDRGLLFAESLYEVLPITAGQPRMVEAHVARMIAGASRLGLDTSGLTAATWRDMVARLREEDPVNEGTLYVQLTGGSATRAHLPGAPTRPRLFAYLLPHRFPRAEQTRAGITATVVPDTRWAHCDMKTTMLLPAVLAKRAAHERGADEALFARDGHLTEGASSNLFLVRGTTLVTPPLSPDLLPGITRALTLELARELGHAIEERPIAVDDLGTCDELFVSSTSRLVMPVHAVDGVNVGGTEPTVALALADAMRARLDLT